MSFAARSVQLTALQVELLTPPFAGPDAVAEFVATLAASPPRLSAEILAVKAAPAGAGVSYGHTFRTPVPTTLALVAIGYGHGMPRKAGNCASVTWGTEGVRMPIVGRVAMDVLVVDAGAAPVRPGQSVAFFGDPEAGEWGVTEWAASVGEHPFSILASIDARVTREVVG